jgi:hypothetical protein
MNGQEIDSIYQRNDNQQQQQQQQAQLHHQQQQKIQQRLIRERENHLMREREREREKHLQAHHHHQQQQQQQHHRQQPIPSQHIIKQQQRTPDNSPAASSPVMAQPPNIPAPISSHNIHLNMIGNMLSKHGQTTNKQIDPNWRQQTNSPDSASNNATDDLLNAFGRFLHSILVKAKQQMPEKYNGIRNMVQDLLEKKIDPEFFMKRIQDPSHPPSLSSISFLKRAMIYWSSINGDCPAMTIERFLEVYSGIILLKLLLSTTTLKI